MGKYIDTSVQDLLGKINEEYFLPELQREFVWDNDVSKFADKVYSLFDSITRGYPIGTFLFWEVDFGTLERNQITVLKFINDNLAENEPVGKDKFLNKKIQLVLDGQQRITLLNLAFNGVFTQKYYKKRKKFYLFFNLLCNPKIDKDDAEQDINVKKYEFKLFENEKDCFQEDNKIWYKIGYFFTRNVISGSEQRKIFDQFKIKEPELQDLVRDNISQFYNAITKLNLSYYNIQSAEEAEALEIFVRVNSGGVVLSYSDLLFSKIKHFWKKGDSPLVARSEFKELLNEINADSFNFDSDFLLKAALYCIDKDVRYRLKNFTPENIQLIKSNWETLKKCLKTTKDFLNQANITNSKVLRSKNAIIPILYFIKKTGSYSIEPYSKNFDLLKKYIYIALLNGVFGGQSDEILVSTRKILTNISANQYFPLEDILKEIKKKKPIAATPDQILEIIKETEYNSDTSYLILNLIYGSIFEKVNFHEDHMYPQTSMKKIYDKKIVDNIGNVQALGSYTNQSKLDEKFSEWIKKNEKNEKYCEIHLVPKLPSYDETQFETFVKERQSLIVKKIMPFFDFLNKETKT